MKRIPILAEVNSFTGYGQHLIALVTGLEKHGYFVSIRTLRTNTAVPVPPEVLSRIVQCVQPEPYEILLAHPYEMPTPGKKTIYITMWESTKLPPRSVQLLNMAEAVIVPCQWNARNFRASGVKRPIFVVPLGIDPSVFKNSFKPKSEIVFGAGGRNAHGATRKGVQEVIYCFQEAFRGRDDVKLKLKMTPEDHVHIPESDSRIEVIKQFMLTKELAEWMSSLTCFVSAAKAEAWGLLQHQSMACGVPVIASIYGGLEEFMNHKNSYPVRYFTDAVTEAYLGGGEWAQPYLVDMVEQMRRVAENREAAAYVGLQASADAARFTWDHSVNMLVKALDHIMSPQTVIVGEVEPESPKVEFAPFVSVEEQLKGNGWEYGEFKFESYDGRVRFNPSIVRHAGKMHLAVRSAELHNGNRVNNQIELWDLDAVNLETSNKRVLRLTEGCEHEDPRLISVNIMNTNQLAISFTSVRPNHPPCQEVTVLDENFNPIEIFRPNYGRNSGAGTEKNWMWFHDGAWRFMYTMQPMVVVTPDVQELRTHQNIPWKWGQVRGGTPLFRLSTGHQLMFFHSSLPWRLERRHYYMGACVIEDRPPYRITQISQSPLLAGCPNMPLEIVPHACVFPSGIVRGKNTSLISFGVNDEKSMWVRIPDDDVLKNLIAV